MKGVVNLKRENFLMIGIIVLIILNFYSFSKMNDLQEDINQFQNIRQDIQSVNDSVSQVSVELEDKLTKFTKDNAWIQDKTSTVKTFNLNENTINLVLTWKLKELSKGENISFFYRSENETEWHEIKVETNDSLSFSIEQEFSPDKNYETKIVASSSDGGARGEEFLPLDIQQQIQEHVMIDPMIIGTVPNHYDINIDIRNSLKSELFGDQPLHEFNLLKAEAIIYVDEKVKEKIDLLKKSAKGKEDSDTQILKYTKTVNLEDSKSQDIKVVIKAEDVSGNKFEKQVDEIY